MRNLIFTLGLALFGILMPRISLADDNIPKADILDVVFNEDGTAYDASPMDNKVEVIGKEMMTTYYNENYKRVVPRLSNPWGGNGATYYKVDYENNQAFKDALANGHTLEIVVMADYTIGSLPDSECKPFTSHQSGGTGLMVAKKNKSANGTNDFAFLPHTGGSYRWVLSGVHPEPGIYYHVVGVYNKEEGKGYIYVNGELKGTADAPGDFQFASAGNVWFGIGADPNGATGNTAWNGEVAIARIYDAPLTAEQIAALYKQVEVNRPDYRQLLKNSLDSINAIGDTFPEGTNPGYYTAEALSQYKTAYDDIALKALNAIEGSASDDEYITLRTDLLNAYNAIHEHANPISDGYYYFINAYPNFKLQGSEMAMSTNDNELTWEAFNGNSALQLFKVTKLADGNFSIQNTASGKYINTVAGTSVHIPMSATQETPQTFTLLHSAQWNIANESNPISYHTEGHKNGAGTSGYVVPWSAGAGSCSAWYLNQVTDQALIDRLLAAGSKQILADRLKKAIGNSTASRLKADDYTALITSAGQIASNSKAQDGNLANLIDGNTGTIFHSEWNAIMGDDNTEEGIGWHNLQISLGKEISKMKFRFNGRNNTDGWHDNPTHITLYGTNDDALGASTAAADSLQWTEIVDMTKDAYGFPGNDNAVSYQSPVIDLKGSYKYLRFVVKHVSTMDGGNRKTSFAVPSITGVTFNLSEFQIYDANPAESSEYFKVAGMKEACDTYDKLVAEAQEKMANLTVTEADIEAINAAAKAIDDLYVDRDALDTKLAELATKARSIYDTATGSRITLITDAAQISSNSNSGDGTIAGLIDGDKNTIFHSFWSTDMQKADITADEWIASMDAVESLDHTGTGYHNLQVKLNEPVKSFYFQYYGRNSDWHDNPNDIQIFATNDDELGASTDNADQDSWTAITELNEGFPEDVVVLETPYTSPTIELGDSYKYIRFVVRNTTHAGKVDTRVFNNPDVTGITFNLSEFQMYSGLDKDRIQYDYIPGMKDACDAMKAILDVADKMGKHEMVTSEFNDKFEAAINAVEALYADTTELAALAKSYRDYIAKSVVSEENYGLGYVDSEESIDAFANAVTEAKNGVSPTSPTKEQIDNAIARMREAFKTFATHIGKLEPNKWYNIFGGSTYDYTQGQPIYLGSTSTGDQLHIGTYPIETADPTADPYSIWRLVPMEGQEPTGDAIGCYAIQNMGTGQYFGAYRGQGASLSPLMSHEKTPYNIYYYGNGKFKMQQVGVKEPFDCLKTDKANFIVLNYPADGGEQQSFIFKPVENDYVTISWYFDNSLNTMVLPWAVDGLAEFNEAISAAKVKTYAVKSLTTTEAGSRLELKEKSSFEAGEPFIIAVNDYTQCDNDAKQPVYFPLPTTVTDTSAIVANGLIGTLQGMTVAAPGMGIFNYDAATTSWKLAASTANQFISGRYGYIDPKKVVNEEGDADLVLETADQVTAVKPFIVTKAGDKVNVYSIDGKLLKRNVKATEAQKGLKKGIYIIGKKKIAVK